MRSGIITALIVTALIVLVHVPVTAQGITSPPPATHPTMKTCTLVKEATSSVRRHQPEVTGPRLTEAILGLKEILGMPRAIRGSGPRCNFQVYSRHAAYWPRSDDGIWEAIAELGGIASELRIDLRAVLTAEELEKIAKLSGKK